MNLVSYVDILEVVGELKDFKAKLVEGEGLANSGGVVEVSIEQAESGVFNISAICHSTEDKGAPYSVQLTVVSEPRSLDCKCTCADENSGKCKHVVASLIYLHRNNITVSPIIVPFADKTKLELNNALLLKTENTTENFVEQHINFCSSTSTSTEQSGKHGCSTGCNTELNVNTTAICSGVTLDETQVPGRGASHLHLLDEEPCQNQIVEGEDFIDEDTDVIMKFDVSDGSDCDWQPEDKNSVRTTKKSLRTMTTRQSATNQVENTEQKQILRSLLSGSCNKENQKNDFDNMGECPSNTGANLEEYHNGSDDTESSEETRTGRGRRKRVPNPKYISDTKKFSCAFCLKSFEKKAHYEEHVRSHTGEKPHECEVCGRRYSQKRSLMKHREEGGEEGCRGKIKFPCEVCDRKFDRQALLDDHSLIHTDRRDFKCTECNKTFTYKRGLDVHLRMHCKEKMAKEGIKAQPDERKFVCDVCGKGFRKGVHLKQHKVTHSSEKPFKCLECGKCFSRQRSLSAHSRDNKNCQSSSSTRARPKPSIKCETCGKLFSNRMHHEEHVRSHTGERPFQCVECGKGFASKRSLRNHSHDGPNARNRPHMCAQCPSSFATAFMLKTHQRSHSDEKPWVCAECGKGYRSQHVFQDHQNQHRGIKAHTCKECGKSFTWRTSLWAHTREHAREKPFECVQCGSMFAEQSELKDHWAVHLDDKPHQCPECGIGFMLKTDLDLHIETHKKIPEHACSMCDKKYTRADEFNRHMQTHKEKKKSICPHCGQLFTNKGHLKVHMLIHSGVKPFECETCHKRFYTRSLLRKHTVFHSTDRPFECALCGDKFLTLGILRAHVRTHTGERPYTCTECGKSFPQSTYLKRHALTHSGERPFPCNVCDNAFVSRYDLKIHMRTHTGEKPFGCDDCGERFYERAQLTSHRRLHTGERPFMCDVCGKGFNSSNHVKKHFGRVHPETPPFPCAECGERFMMCEALRKHKRCTHLTGNDRISGLARVAPLVESEKQQMAGANPLDCLVGESDELISLRKDPLNRLIEDSQILVDDQSDQPDELTDHTDNAVLTAQQIEFVGVPGTALVNIVNTSGIQMKLTDEFSCQTVQVFHAEPLTFSPDSQFETVSLTELPTDSCSHIAKEATEQSIT